MLGITLTPFPPRASFPNYYWVQRAPYAVGDRLLSLSAKPKASITTQEGQMITLTFVLYVFLYDTQEVHVLFLFNRTTLQVFVTYLTCALYVYPL